MKKIALSLAIVASLFTACSPSEDAAEPVKVPVVGEITGDLTVSKTYAFGNYTLKGFAKVASGVTITFEAGSTITANPGDGEDAFVILNGGKLIAVGTAAEPIVFTSSVKSAGSWGGIIMYGDAPIVNSATAPAPQTATSEDGLVLPYGGSNATHNGGTLKYVRVEYAGQVITQNNKEQNGFSFYSVGSGTILENLVSYKGNDDGYEFYGGTVSAKNLISYGNSDDAFDWQDGWRGDANTNWLAYQVATGNYGMEIEAKSFNNSFGPKVSNITLTRAPGTVTEGGSSAAEYDAIQFKKEGNGEYSNVVISGYTTVNSTAVRIQDKATFDNQVTGGKIKLLNVKINDGTSQFAGVGTTFTVVFPAGNYTTSTTATGATLTPGAWAIVDGVSLIK